MQKIAQWRLRMPDVFRYSKIKVRDIVSNDLDFIMASIAYIAASIIDYLFTVSGVWENPLREGNPMIQEYINHFGPKNGVLICKLIIGIGVLCATLVIYLRYKEKKTKIRADYILYGGAIITTIAGLLWIF